MECREGLNHIHEQEPEIQWTQDNPLSEQATTYTAKPPQPSNIPMLPPTPIQILGSQFITLIVNRKFRLMLHTQLWRS